jgi:hypothetical protein
MGGTWEGVGGSALAGAWMHRRLGHLQFEGACGSRGGTGSRCSGGDLSSAEGGHRGRTGLRKRGSRLGDLNLEAGGGLFHQRTSLNIARRPANPSRGTRAVTSRAKPCLFLVRILVSSCHSHPMLDQSAISHDYRRVHRLLCCTTAPGRDGEGCRAKASAQPSPATRRLPGPGRSSRALHGGSDSVLRFCDDVSCPHRVLMRFAGVN